MKPLNETSFKFKPCRTRGQCYFLKGAVTQTRRIGCHGPPRPRGIGWGRQHSAHQGLSQQLLGPEKWRAGQNGPRRRPPIDLTYTQISAWGGIRGGGCCRSQNKTGEHQHQNTRTKSSDGPQGEGGLEGFRLEKIPALAATAVSSDW